jgi:hypothetical protein
MSLKNFCAVVASMLWYAARAHKDIQKSLDKQGNRFTTNLFILSMGAI